MKTLALCMAFAVGVFGLGAGVAGAQNTENGQTAENSPPAQMSTDKKDAGADQGESCCPMHKAGCGKIGADGRCAGCGMMMAPTNKADNTSKTRKTLGRKHLGRQVRIRR